VSISREPELRDEVKHKTQEASGTVLAKYKMTGSDMFFIDVRLPNDQIYYASPAINWTITTPVEELE